MFISPVLINTNLTTTIQGRSLITGSIFQMRKQRDRKVKWTQLKFTATNGQNWDLIKQPRSRVYFLHQANSQVISLAFIQYHCGIGIEILTPNEQSSCLKELTGVCVCARARQREREGEREHARNRGWVSMEQPPWWQAPCFIQFSGHCIWDTIATPQLHKGN